MAGRGGLTFVLAIAVATIMVSPLGGAPSAQERKGVLTLSTSVIDPGGAVRVSWATSSREAFLTDVGLVAGEGSRELKPQTTREFVLLYEEGGHFEVARARIEVRGSRGDAGGFPDLGEFPATPVRSEVSGLTLPQFADRLTKVLQDDFRFHLRFVFRPGATEGLIYTDRQERAELLRPADRTIRRRRAAYQIRVSQAASVAGKPGIITFEIAALVEYQKLSEARWRAEVDEAIVRAAVDQLRPRLEKG